MASNSTMLAELHAHKRDAQIKFDAAPHVYTIELDNGVSDSKYLSVTKWNHSQVAPITITLPYHDLLFGTFGTTSFRFQLFDVNSGEAPILIDTTLRSTPTGLTSFFVNGLLVGSFPLTSFSLLAASVYMYNVSVMVQNTAVGGVIEARYYFTRA
jgi:hypothetical protein